MTLAAALAQFNADVAASEHPPIFPFNGSGGPDYLGGWDLCFIGGNPLPGIAEVAGPGIQLKRDPNGKAGSNGGKPVYHGLEEQLVKVKSIIWTQSQLAILWGLRADLIPLPGVDPKNRSIDSPWLKMVAISSVAVIGASPLMPHSSPRCARGLEMTFNCVHWLGGAKAHGTNVSVQPRRKVDTTEKRKYTPGAPAPTAVAGGCAPSFTPGT